MFSHRDELNVLLPAPIHETQEAIILIPVPENLMVGPNTVETYFLEPVQDFALG